ncbi:MAG: geranylgeranyl reductase family protein [Vicinamibacterales bacterium]
MLDVAIVGGGPGGLVAAARLAGSGYRVAVFEEHDGCGTPVHCTGVLARDAIAELDLPVQAVLNPLSTVRFVAPSGGHFSYTTPQVEAVVIDRLAFDRALADRALAAGAGIRHGRRVGAVQIDPDGARLTLDDGEEIEAAAIVLACGASYGLQRRLGLGMPSTFLQSAQLELPAARPGDVEIHFGSEIAPKGFAWAVPVMRPSGGHVRVGVMAESDAGVHFARMLERVAGPWGIDRANLPEPRRRMLPLSTIRRSYADRLLVIGDAAGMVKPTTGGGIYYSVVSAHLAARILDGAFAAGDLSATTLREFERQWRREFHREFAAQLALRFLAERLGDSDIDRLFDLARTDGIMPIVRRTAKFNRHRDFIFALLRHPPARRVLLGQLAALVHP